MPCASGAQAKRVNVWVLAPEAISNGVKSTTRYRKHGASKKSNKLVPSAPQRQRSGRKGGLAAKKAARLRRAAEEHLKRHGGDSNVEIGNFAPCSPLTPNDITEDSLYSPFDPYYSSNIPDSNYMAQTMDYTSVHSTSNNIAEFGLFYDDEEAQRNEPKYALFNDAQIDPILSN